MFLTMRVDFSRGGGGIIENIVEVLSDAFHVHIYGWYQAQRRRRIYNVPVPARERLV